MIYVFVLIYILFCIYYFDYKKRTSIWSYGLLCIIFILISGLSYRLGCDVIRYQNWFESNFDIPFTMTAFLRSENIGGHAQEPLWFMLIGSMVVLSQMKNSKPDLMNIKAC